MGVTATASAAGFAIAGIGGRTQSSGGPSSSTAGTASASGGPVKQQGNVALRQSLVYLVREVIAPFGALRSEHEPDRRSG